MELLKTLSKSERSKNLVYTSAGDHSVLANWRSDDGDYDIFVCQYGDEASYADDADYYVKNKGGKFPNLIKLYQAYPDIFESYDAIFTTDDDIEIDADGIKRLFKMREEYDLWILHPSYHRRGKVSFFETLHQPCTEIRYTNFVENTCPLFRTDKLLEFLGVFDTRLNGWGIDIWFCNVILKKEEKNKCAIADSVICLNPKDEEKPGGKREIEKLQKTEDRKKIWADIANTHNLPLVVGEIKVYDTKFYPLFGLFRLKTLKDLIFYIKYRIVYRYYESKRSKNA